MTRALRYLTSLPKRLVVNPILARELRVAGRKRGTYINRAAFACILAVGILFVLLTFTRSSGWGGSSIIYRAQELTQTVQFLTYSLLWTGFTMLVVLGPVLTAGSICDERRARTLDTLATTPISPLQIVVGKIAARMQEAVTLALIAAPALLALRVFGGVPGETIIAFVTVSLATTYLGAALGIWYSSWHRGSAGAIVYAFLTLALLTIAPAVIAGVGFQSNFYNAASLGIPVEWLPAIFGAVFATCPPAVLVFEMSGGTIPFAVPASLVWLVDHPWVATSAWLVLQATVLVMIAARSVRIQLLKAEEGGAVKAKADDEQESPRIRKLKASPVYWRESTAKLFPKAWHMIVIMGVLAGFVGWAYAQVGLDEDRLHQLFGFTGLALVTLLAAVSTTGAISAEREARTWEVLMTVPLSGRHILASKILASAKRIAVPIGILLLHYIGSAFLGHINAVDIPFMAIIIASTAMFYLASGLFFSLMFKKIITAVACNIAMLIGLWLGVAIMALMLAEFAFDSSRQAEDAIGVALFVYHPVAMLASTIDHAVNSVNGADFAKYQFADERIEFPVFAAAVIGQSVFYILGATGFFVLSLRAFKARGGRVS